MTGPPEVERESDAAREARRDDVAFFFLRRRIRLDFGRMESM